MKRFRLAALLCGAVCALSGPLAAEPLSFSATGCGPYTAEEEPLLERYVDLVNRDGKSAFLVHLGDVVTGKNKRWPESQYTKVANILRKSRLPVLVVLGDNEWNDQEDPVQALQFWDRNFRDFEAHWKPGIALAKQSVRKENFAFTSQGVLLVGLNIVGGRVHDAQEWQVRLQQDADWVKEQFTKHATDVRAAVLLAQARPTENHELFFRQLADACRTWKHPVLYLHADGHTWEVEKAWRAPNLLRVQTDQVGRNPPVLVTVTDDPHEPFVFDRRIGAVPPPQK